MKISSLFEQGRPLYSFEIFPPKRTAPVETIYHTLEQLDGLHPDFISVTFGAAGIITDKHNPLEIATMIKERCHTEAMMHLTCINSSRADIDEISADAQQRGIENILVLRGDRMPDIAPRTDFRYAEDLAAYLSRRGGFCLSGACYPEGHLDSPDLQSDIGYLRRKVDAGCSHLVSQLFFDNRFFYDFLDRARGAGIAVPISAGIMPVTSKSQIEKMITLCGASLPNKFAKMMQRYEHYPQALMDAGVAYAIDQIIDLVAQGVDGVHLYTMNNPGLARRITDSVSSLFKAGK
ncbi:MAG: methylenetetrahydrofolate reductase [NAD(P)H] [Clostridia bacterium]|nr:methylenetetrahydrofolate reductase [NAD(P)H] [Clostridia bacterium]